jgi:hypothetical protein
LPNLHFLADDQPYHQSKWWLSDSSGRSLIATVLWRKQPADALLAVATHGNVDVLNLLLTPRSVTLDGPACTDPTRAGSSQILKDNGAVVQCEDEPGILSTRLCHDGGSDFRMVAYSGKPDAGSLAAVLGSSSLLVPIE